MRHAIRSCLFATTLLAARVARADELAIATTEHGDWPTSVAALETDGTNGSTLHVVVTDGDTPLACDEYSLQLDEVGRSALTIGACDPDTNATLVRLADRHALFAHDDLIARPLAVGITAVQIRTTGSRGGASTQSGSTEHCTIEVHPYLVDPETHAHVPLLSPRFVLRVADAHVESVGTSDGWILRSSETGGLEITYDVLDTTTNRVVTTERAELTCGGGPTAPAPFPIPDLLSYSAPTPAPTPEAPLPRFALVLAPTLHIVPGGSLGAGADVLEPGAAVALRIRLVAGLYVGAEVQAASGGVVGAPVHPTASLVSALVLMGMRLQLGAPVFFVTEVAAGNTWSWYDGAARDQAFAFSLRAGVESELSRNVAIGGRFGVDFSDGPHYEAAITLSLMI